MRLGRTRRDVAAGTRLKSGKANDGKKNSHVNFTWEFGADAGTRTRDLILTKDVRYHLCHISKRRLVL